MSDEQENVGAGSETSGDQGVNTTETTSTNSTSETTATDTGATASQDAPADQSAGGAAEPKTGDPCVCPDGRKGTVHVLDEGLVCLPNQG